MVKFIRCTERYRDIVKGGFWERLLVLWYFCGVPRTFMQDRKVQRLQFHNLLHRPREDLITRNLRMRDHRKREPFSKLWILW